jgi:hypothetical protein
MPALKCPNPSCPFLFDPTRVPAGALLTCPRCGMRFTLGPAPAASPTTFVAPAAEPGQVFEDAPPTRVVSAGPEATAPPRRRSEGGIPVLLTMAGVLLLFGVILAVIVGAMWTKRGLTHGEGGGPAELLVPDKNFSYRLPDPPWAKDPTTQNDLGVHAFAFHRTEPDACVALEVSDFGNQTPSDADLKEKMTEQLRRVFLNLPDDPPLEPAKWAGHDAKRCQFRAEHKATGTVCLGECYVFGFKGVGYWFYAWAAEQNAAAVAEELVEMRGRFRTLDERKNWSGRTGFEATFRSESGNYQYKLTAYEPIWKKPALALTDEDPKADLLLKAELKGRQKKDFPPQAMLVMLVLKEDGDPAEIADKYVRKRHSPDPEVFGPTRITDLTGDPAGDATPGPADGGLPATRLMVSPGGENASKSAEKLVVFSAIRVGDAVVVAEGSCPWPQRAAWERRLIQLVGSLRE